MADPAKYKSLSVPRDDWEQTKGVRRDFSFILKK